MKKLKKLKKLKNNLLYSYYHNIKKSTQSNFYNK
jgi:septin family protein